jgi:hypothetical protein
MMEAARTSETSVDIQLRTLQYIPEDSELQINPLSVDPETGLTITPQVFSLASSATII